MRLICKLTVVIFASGLGGCDYVNAVLMSSSEKINRAVPIPPDLITAQSIFYAALEANKQAKTPIEEQFDQLLTVRALTCSGAARVGRFELPSDVKPKLTDLDCFKKQDAKLADWMGLQRVAFALRLPALRPYTELKDKLIIPSAESSVTLAVAASANIAVVKSNTGKFTTLDLSGGKPLNNFQAPGEAYRLASISPNGRMLAVPVSNRSLTIFDLESGTILWSTDKYSEVVAWIPSVEALVLNETGASKAALMDLRTSQIEPYLSAERNLTWALGIPGPTNQLLMGSQNSASLVDHARSAEGTIVTTTVKQWRLNGSGASAAAPLLMLNGKLLAFASNRDLAWLNLENNQQGMWEMSAIGAQGFAKFDENTIIFTDRKSNSSAATRKLLDVENLTVSTALDISATEGHALPLMPRAGYARSLNSALVIQTTAQADNPQPLSQLIAEAQLQAQLAKLQVPPETATQWTPVIYSPAEIAAAQAAAAAAAAAVALSEARPRAERQNYIELLTQQVRSANVVSAMRDGLSREYIERIKNGTQQKSASANPAPSSPAPPAFKPLLTDIPNNAQVSIIGVYQAPKKSPSSLGGSSRIAGDVRVTIEAGSTPLVLVLSSYEPVRWNIKNTSQRKIAAVLISGYYDSEAIGLANTKILKIGSSYAYKLDSPEYNRLKTEVSRYVSNPVVSFQGRYEGQEFAIAP